MQFRAADTIRADTSPNAIPKILKPTYVGREWKLQDPARRGPDDQRAPHRTDDCLSCQYSEPAG